MNNIPAHRLSIVVPMYNEVDNVEPFVTAVHQALDKYPHEWELIIVNDGSRDGTQKALDEQAKLRGPHVRPIHLWRNFRQTAAMQAGIDASRGDVIVTLDGDLQNDPIDIPKLVEKLLKQLAFPAIPDLGAGAANICDRKQVECGQVAFVLDHRGEGRKHIRVREVLFLSDARHDQVMQYKPDHQFAVFGTESVTGAKFLGVNRAELGVAATATLGDIVEEGSNVEHP